MKKPALYIGEFTGRLKTFVSQDKERITFNETVPVEKDKGYVFINDGAKSRVVRVYPRPFSDFVFPKVHHA